MCVMCSRVVPGQPRTVALYGVSQGLLLQGNEYHYELCAHIRRLKRMNCTLHCNCYYGNCNTGVVYCNTCVVCCNTGMVYCSTCVVCCNTYVVCCNTGMVYCSTCVVCCNTGMVYCNTCVVCCNTGMVSVHKICPASKYLRSTDSVFPLRYWQVLQYAGFIWGQFFWGGGGGGGGGGGRIFASV